MFRNQKYDYSSAKTIADIIPEKLVTDLEIKNDQIDLVHKRGMRVKKRFAQRVFFDFLNMVIDDSIENGNKFISPGRYWFSLYIKEMNDQTKQRILKNGKIYTDVDLIASDFKIYGMVFYSVYLKKKKYRSVRISHRKYKELISRVNKGQRYYS